MTLGTKITLLPKSSESCGRCTFVEKNPPKCWAAVSEPFWEAAKCQLNKKWILFSFENLRKFEIEKNKNLKNMAGDDLTKAYPSSTFKPICLARRPHQLYSKIIITRVTQNSLINFEAWRSIRNGQERVNRTPFFMSLSL
jgi:hypothetical protein